MTNFDGTNAIYDMLHLAGRSDGERSDVTQKACLHTTVYDHKGFKIGFKPNLTAYDRLLCCASGVKQS